MKMFNFIKFLVNETVIAEEDDVQVIRKEYTIVKPNRPIKIDSVKDTKKLSEKNADLKELAIDERQELYDNTISITEALKIFEIPRKKIYEICKSGSIDAYLEKNRWIISKESLAKYLKNNPIG